jgi:hypothetical protein
MLTRTKRISGNTSIPGANKYSVIGKFFTLMQGIRRLYEDGYGKVINSRANRSGRT